MKKFMSICLVVLVLFSGCSSSKGKNISTFYDSTYWGMSKSEILKLISYVDYYDETETEIKFKDARVLNMHDYSTLTLATFNPFNGGYQLPEVTYKFEDEKLSNIDVNFKYESKEDFDWYTNMVEWLGITYTQEHVIPLDETAEYGMYVEGTSFKTDEEGTDILVITTQHENSITENYGGLTIRYAPNN